MEKEKSILVPTSTSCYIDKDKGSKSLEERKYWGMVGSLQYLTTSRLQILRSKKRIV